MIGGQGDLVVPVGQVQQQAVPAAALDQGGDRRADDQIAFPVPGHRPVGGLRRPLADLDQIQDPRRPSRPGLGLPAGLTQRSPGAQTLGQLSAQRTPALHEQRLIDRLVRHPHLRLAGKLGDQPGRDQLR